MWIYIAHYCQSL